MPATLFLFPMLVNSLLASKMKASLSLSLFVLTCDLCCWLVTLWQRWCWHVVLFPCRAFVVSLTGCVRSLFLLPCAQILLCMFARTHRAKKVAPNHCFKFKSFFSVDWPYVSVHVAPAPTFLHVFQYDSIIRHLPSLWYICFSPHSYFSFSSFLVFFFSLLYHGA